MLKGFGILNEFGQPTLQWAKNVKTSKPAKMSSIDDFNKYFDKKIFSNKFERSPKTDTVTKSSNIEKTDIPDLLPDLFGGSYK
ncbi:TPA: hypothetical protein IAC10_12325 [Candidatus Scatousia excrementigallinarum]|uniref:Uncharacterized protein n=1 Tax=Candidatus Scatousia excrementigallinarum TaxID=2840935 RepID=A0A9D1F0X8_9BACT|nr:hypothetical protein [Candidatus Scatousia excrementigallinarum]